MRSAKTYSSIYLQVSICKLQQDRKSFFFEIATSFKVNECERFHLFLPVVRMSFLLLFGLSIAANPFSRRDHLVESLRRITPESAPEKAYFVDRVEDMLTEMAFFIVREPRM